MLLRQSAQLHDLSEHAVIDAKFYDRSPAGQHYCLRISYRVQKLKDRIFAAYDYAHNVRIVDNRYNQRSMTKTVNLILIKPITHNAR